MRTVIPRLVLFSVLCGLPGGVYAQARPATEPTAPEEDRALIFTLELPDSPAKLFRRWTTEHEARRFLALDVRIDRRVGGRYVALFDPENDPAGALAGTYGSTIVALEPPKRLVFEWNSLTPRAAAEVVGGRRVLQKSLVEVRFTAVGDCGERTRLRIRHYGMGRDPDWDASYRFYRDQGWPWILDRLRALYPGLEEEGIRSPRAACRARERRSGRAGAGCRG